MSNTPTEFATLFVTVYADGEDEPFVAIRCDRLDDIDNGVLTFFHKDWKDNYILMTTVHDYSWYQVIEDDKPTASKNLSCSNAK